MRPFDKHVFVCVNERGEDHPRGCCKSRNGAAVRAQLKKAVVDAGLKGRVRINQAGCLDQCEEGVTLVFERHIRGGEPVERLRIDRD
jgi:predicted metal-binding protein